MAPVPAGRYWCWVHWSLDVPSFDLMQARELHVRAWDDSQNGQPAAITWNVMGMMNNCHYRMLVHPHVDAAGNLGVRFQHPAPVEVGALGNIGWREEDNLRKQVGGTMWGAFVRVCVCVCAPCVKGRERGGGTRMDRTED